MSLEAILAAIEASGEAEITQMRTQAESRAQQVLAEAERKAATIREDARQAALVPIAGERAQRLHRAKLEALQTTGEVRDGFVNATLSEARQHLANFRTDSRYPIVLRRLIEEALSALGTEEAGGDRPVLEVDLRDERPLGRILDSLGLDLSILPSLGCWGGVVARSGDGRIVVTDTLEARLERAGPLLRRELAALFEKEVEGSQPRSEFAAVA